MPALPLAALLRRALRAHALTRPGADLLDAIRAPVGVYSAAPTCHLSAAARFEGYTISQLDQALLTDRTLLRIPAMRGSVYVMPLDLAPAALAITNRGAIGRMFQRAGLDDAAMQRAADAVEEALAEQHRSAAEVRSALGEAAPPGELLTLLLRQLGNEGRIVRTRTRGGARSQTYEYARMADWVALPPLPSRHDALCALAPAWFEANGPATAADLAWWAGATIKEANAALKGLDLVTVEVQGIKGPLLAPPVLRDDLLSAPGEEADDEALHLLPVWDVWLMSHRDRTRHLAAERTPFVVDASGNVTSTILRGGRVVGTWDLDGDTLLYAPFEPLDEGALVAAAGRFSAVFPLSDAREATPTPLAEGGQNAFQAPLKPR